MKLQRKRRLYFIFILVMGIFTAVGLALFALRQNINLYDTPTQLLEENSHRFVRLGGLVERGSVKRQEASLKVSFRLTDFNRTVIVEYKGLLPSLFREGQGVVAEGHLNTNGVFIADQVLAKHDEKYHPPTKKVQP